MDYIDDPVLYARIYRFRDNLPEDMREHFIDIVTSAVLAGRDSKSDISNYSFDIF